MASDTIAARMKVWLTRNYGSLTEGSKALGMTYANMSQYLNGKRHPGFEILTRFRQAGCDVNWLITGDEIPRAEIEKMRERVRELESAIKAIQSIKFTR